MSGMFYLSYILSIHNPHHSGLDFVFGIYYQKHFGKRSLVDNDLKDINTVSLIAHMVPNSNRVAYFWEEILLTYLGDRTPDVGYNAKKDVCFTFPT